MDQGGKRGFEEHPCPTQPQAGHPGDAWENVGTPTHVHAAVLFNYRHEAGGLEDLLGHRQVFAGASLRVICGDLRGQRVIVAYPSEGSLDAGGAAAVLWQAYRPSWIISAGFAGALTPERELFDVCFITSIVDGAERHATPEPPALPPALPDPVCGKTARPARLVIRQDVPTSCDDKSELRQKFCAELYEVGSSALGDFCQISFAKVVLIRIVAESFDEIPSRETRWIVTQTSWAARAGAIIGSLFRGRTGVKSLWGLFERQLVASDRLAQFLAELIHRLPA